jgi:hypothetical protein
VVLMQKWMFSTVLLVFFGAKIDVFQLFFSFFAPKIGCFPTLLLLLAKKMDV